MDAKQFKGVLQADRVIDGLTLLSISNDNKGINYDNYMSTICLPKMLKLLTETIPNTNANNLYRRTMRQKLSKIWKNEKSIRRLIIKIYESKKKDLLWYE